jgi:integrase
MILIAAVAGLRISEVLALQPRDLDAAAQTLSVKRRYYRGDVDEPKSESSRRTRFVGPLMAMLERQAEGKKPDAFLFCREDGLPPDARDLQISVWKPAAERAGCYHVGFGPHVFRRLNITLRQHCGATAIEAMRGAGHSSLSQTWLYTIDDDGRERDQVNKLWERIKPGDNDNKA